MHVSRPARDEFSFTFISSSSLMPASADAFVHFNIFRPMPPHFLRFAFDSFAFFRHLPDEAFRVPSEFLELLHFHSFLPASFFFSSASPAHAS